MSNLDQQKQIINSIRQCQRNWDLSKDIPQEHLDHLIYIATHSPSKQDEAYYNLHVITNKELIQELLNHTFAFSIPVVANQFSINLRNTQMGANAYFLWTRKDPPTQREMTFKGVSYSTDDTRRKENAYAMIGIAMGLVAYAAGSLGYKTGFNSNHGQSHGSMHIWKNKLGIPENEDVTFGLGIGFPQEDRARNETDEVDFKTGGSGDPVYSHNVIETKSLEFNGKQYPVPPLAYRTFSGQLKDIKVFLH
jgi:nitroreductase